MAHDMSTPPPVFCLFFACFTPDFCVHFLLVSACFFLEKQAVEEWTFSPENGDVVFCSALDGWGFGLGDFAKIWAKRVGCKPRELRRMLWGSFVLNAKTKKAGNP